MRSRPQARIGLLVTLFACALAVDAAPAVSAPSDKPAKEPHFAVRFAMPASNGYRLSFTAHTGGETARLTVKKLDRRGGGAQVQYRVQAETVTRRRVRASFGPFGEVDVRFDARRKVKDPDDCHPTIVGTFRGMIDFEGDNGFTAADATAVEGAIKRGGFGPPLPCFLQREAGHDGMDGLEDIVFLIACRPSGLGYAAIDGLDARKVFHIAELQQRLGGVDVTRLLVEPGTRSTFTYSRDGRRARVRPPAPFTGAARLRARRLRGDLKVPLPGVESPVALTPMLAGMRRGPRCPGGALDRAAVRGAASLSGA